MQVKIKRIDKELPLPAYQTAGSAGFDIYARENTSIAPKTIALVQSNLIIATPPGYMLVVASRSSTPKRKGLMVANGIGIVDSDYSGPEDEVKILVYNFTENEVVVEKGERIAQGLFVKVEQGQWEEVDEMSAKTRGGFGSTGS